MRYILTILTILQTVDAFGQKINNDLILPFQILYAENTKNRMGQNVKSLDMVGIDEVLTIENGGTLSLVHYTGFPIEINNDTTLVVRHLQNAIVPVGKKEKKKKYLETLVEPSIEHLFISKAIEGRKHKLQITGACMDCNFDLEIIYPPRFTEQTPNYSGDLCIKWRAADSNNYKVQMLNTSDRSYSSTKNELTIEDPMTEKELVFMITDMTTGKNSGAFVFKKYVQESLEYPYPCEIKKASFALMAGLYLELSPRDYFEEAEKYFILATNLSDRQFYKDMLDNFRKRRER